MNSVEQSSIVKEEALKAGFTLCGIAAADEMTLEGSRYKEWLLREVWGEMKYLHKNYEVRVDPRKVLPGARSVITLAISYAPRVVIPYEDNFIVARYARGKDYHSLIRNMEDNLISRLDSHFPGSRYQRYVDSGVILEKAWAQRAGIGWQGKNTVLINKIHGSFIFIGVILTDLALEPDQPGKDYCGKCTRCMEACPTGAIEKPYSLNPLKCIAYHTIEVNDEIPEEIRKKMGDRIYGCDICQEVCPFNKKVPPLTLSALDPVPGLSALRKPGWISLTQDEFDEVFRDTAVKRTGYQKLMQTIRSLLPNGKM